MRPPCASTSPWQMMSPRPMPAAARLPLPPSLGRAYLRNSCGSSSGATPQPSSRTETATCTPSRSATIRIGAEWGECRAASESSLLSTCTMRCRSANTQCDGAGHADVQPRSALIPAQGRDERMKPARPGADKRSALGGEDCRAAAAIRMRGGSPDSPDRRRERALRRWPPRLPAAQMKWTWRRDRRRGSRPA